VIPILRAGLVPVELISTVLPAYETYHIGMVRDEKTLQVLCLLQISALLI
jgi:uracil phosphoribosyltransferase